MTNKLVGKKLSELLRIAVADVQKCETDPAYVLDMADWHSPSSSGCHVCMAGAVIAKTLASIPGMVLYPDGFKEDGNSLRMIDLMRGGAFESAATGLKIAPDERQSRALELARVLVLHDYSTRYMRATWKTYVEAADILKAVGL